jgi:NAD+ kinase
VKLRSVGICLKPGQPQAAGLVRGLGKWLEERGLRVGFDEDAAEPAGETATPRDALVREADLVIVLGGDGTLLSVARHAGARAVPILGVNLGTLGFMTEIAQDELFAALERVLGGQMRVESRMRLEVRALREGEAVGSWLALNDAVVANATSARLVEITACVDGDAITTYHADGLIVATPTGSTAYSLSAGGPILDPRLEAFVLTPISPHTLTQRPVVLPGDLRIEISTRGRGGELRLTVDGQTGVSLRDEDRVEIVRSEHPVSLVVSPFRNHFAILREKLRWGAR